MGSGRRKTLKETSDEAEVRGRDSFVRQVAVGMIMGNVGFSSFFSSGAFPSFLRQKAIHQTAAPRDHQSEEGRCDQEFRAT